MADPVQNPTPEDLAARLTAAEQRAQQAEERATELAGTVAALQRGPGPTDRGGSRSRGTGLPPPTPEQIALVVDMTGESEQQVRQNWNAAAAYFTAVAAPVLNGLGGLADKIGRASCRERV